MAITHKDNDPKKPKQKKNMENSIKGPDRTILISSLIQIEGEIYTYLPYLRVEV